MKSITSDIFFNENVNLSSSASFEETSRSGSGSRHSLISHITNSKNEVLNFEINDHQYGAQRKVTLKVNGEVVGEMRFTLHNDYLFINRMDNYTKDKDEPLRGVGSTLFEYAFIRSNEEGLRGKIELDSIGNSPAAYFKMGFRKMSDGAVFLRSLISKYKIAPNKDLQEEIQLHSFYEALKEDASHNLYKADVSFEEAIDHGILDQGNIEFEKFLRSGKQATNYDCKKHYMQGRMYLPDEIIEQKYAEFFNKSDNQLIDHTLHFEQDSNVQKQKDKTEEKLFVKEDDSQSCDNLDNTLSQNLVGETDNIFNQE